MDENIQIERPTRAHPGFIPPHRWTGERSCMVGPFRDEQLAKQYEHWVLHQAGILTSRYAVQKLMDGWYIAVPSRSR